MNYNKIHLRRKALNLTQKDVDYRAGISLGGYQKIEVGGNVTIENLEKITEVLGVMMPYWWEDENTTTSEPDVIYELQKEIIMLKKQIDRDKRTIDQLLDKLERHDH